jgi:hypothetical protein
MRQIIIITCCPEVCLTLRCAVRPLIMHCSYRVRKSAVVAATAAAMAIATAGVGGRLIHAWSPTMLAQLGASLETGLAGMYRYIVPSGLAYRPSTPFAGGGWGGQRED